MKELIRTKVDMFEIGSSLSFEDLERNKDNIEKNLISIEDFCDGVYKIYCNDFIGLGIIKNGFLKRDIVI